MGITNLRATLTCLPLLLALTMSASFAQESKPSPGIRIDDQLTINKCGGCHQRGPDGMMRRLSYIRTTPEVWEQAIKRMVRLNGLSIQPDEARHILRYLSDDHGLAPEEAKPIFWEAEHRLFRDQSDKIPADELQHTCNYCHTIGRVLGQRRTKDDYDKLIAMHIGLFPGAENTLRPRRPLGTRPEAPVALTAPTGSMPAVLPPTTVSAVRADGKYPADVAVDYLAAHQPLITPEWTDWHAGMHNPNLTGKWMLVGYQQGKGRVFGTFTIEAGGVADEFVTKTELLYPASGITVSRSGKGLLYTGYSWRGRSTKAGESAATKTPFLKAPPDPGTDPAEWREALFVARDANTMDGRFFWGGYQEFGIDAHLVRIGSAPLVAGASVFAIKSPSTTQVEIYGANFTPDLKPADFDFGSGISVKRILKRSPTVETVEVEASPNLPSAVRDISLRHSTAERAFTVYDKISYIKVTPDASMARLGGVIAAKQFAQFEAIAYTAGADGKPNTADDLPLGPISAHWGLEEFVSTPGDDDSKFVGGINDNGLFTPNIEGPNPARQKQSNNYPTNNWGDVWVAATYDSPTGPMKARSFLVVTIPVYVRYDQPEVSN